jgi:hypothetical protein
VLQSPRGAVRAACLCIQPNQKRELSGAAQAKVWTLSEVRAGPLSNRGSLVFWPRFSLC